MECRKFRGPSVSTDFYDTLSTFLSAVIRCILFCTVYSHLAECWHLWFVNMNCYCKFRLARLQNNFSQVGGWVGDCILHVLVTTLQPVILCFNNLHVVGDLGGPYSWGVSYDENKFRRGPDQYIQNFFSYSTLQQLWLILGFCNITFPAG